MTSLVVEHLPVCTQPYEQCPMLLFWSRANLHTFSHGALHVSLHTQLDLLNENKAEAELPVTTSYHVAL